MLAENQFLRVRTRNLNCNHHEQFPVNIFPKTILLSLNEVFYRIAILLYVFLGSLQMARVD